MYQFYLINSTNGGFSMLSENFANVSCCNWPQLQVVRDAEDTIVPGLLAAGEARIGCGYGTEPLIMGSSCIGIMCLILLGYGTIQNQDKSFSLFLATPTLSP